MINRSDELRAQISKLEHANLESNMIELSFQAVDHALIDGTVLDFSESSIAHVDRILDSLRNDLPRGIWKMLGFGPSNFEIEVIAKIYGAYIGEVLKFEYVGAGWIMPSSDTFEGAPKLKFKGNQFSPLHQAHDRLTKGIGQKFAESICDLKAVWGKEH